MDECIGSELDLFCEPSVNLTHEKGFHITYQPLGSIESGPLEYFISGSSEDYIDLSRTYLHLVVKIVKHDGSNLTDTDIVEPANLFLHSLFSQVDLFIQDRLVSSSSNTYAYRSYLETILNYGKNALETQMKCALFTNDDDLSNILISTRKDVAAKSSSFDLLGRLHLDMFHQGKYLLNNVNLKLRLIRAKDEFCLHTSSDNLKPKVVLQSASLFVRKVRLSSSVQLSHAKVLQHSNAKYPITRVEAKVFSVAQGLSNIERDNLILGQLPIRCVLGIVETDSFNGNYKKNPFNFHHFKLNFLSLYVNGQQIPYKPYTPDFEKKLFVREYLSVYEGTNLWLRNKDLIINRDNYAKGYTLYCFDLTPDHDAGSSHYENMKQGNLRIEMKFKSPLPSNATVILLCEFQNILQISRDREISLDYPI